MELPTRTLPHNYIAIIKIFAMSLCTVSFTAFYLFIYLFSLRQASNAHVTPEETSEALWVVGHKATKPRSHARKQLNNAAERTGGEEGQKTTPSWCPWVTFAILKLWVLGKGGACKICKSGALSQKTDFPGKRGGGQKLDWRFSIDSSIFNSFLTKGKEEKKIWIKKKQQQKTQHLN